MTLATRCTACGTVFRVVQDQLKVSEGWVRCGRCNEVFNALPALFDLERDAPREHPTPDPRPDEPAEPSESLFYDASQAPAEVDLDISPREAESPGALAAERLDAASERAPPGAEEHYKASYSWGSQRSTPADRVDARDRLDFPDARFDSELPDDALVDGVSAEPGDPGEGHDTAIELPLLEASEPHFVIHAHRRALWKSPRMLALQGGVVAVLLALLGGQAVHHFRDPVAARWPASAPLLRSWCSWAGCTLEAPRRIEDVVVESTSLTRAPGPDAFRLSVVLRNRGNLEVMPPSVELSLTDAAGQAIARRVLSPRDFQARAATLQPGAEAPWQLFLTSSGASRITGYTVEVFYP
ncbi:MAG: zinc-ribbon domain-containing protein [Pseudomonadota bacterium]|nr:zinc-ribbon domain-containing protein [Pseudomonadota bacterium]